MSLTIKLVLPAPLQPARPITRIVRNSAKIGWNLMSASHPPLCKVESAAKDDFRIFLRLPRFAWPELSFAGAADPQDAGKARQRRSSDRGMHRSSRRRRHSAPPAGDRRHAGAPGGGERPLYIPYQAWQGMREYRKRAA